MVQTIFVLFSGSLSNILLPLAFAMIGKVNKAFVFVTPTYSRTAMSKQYAVSTTPT